MSLNNNTSENAYLFTVQSILNKSSPSLLFCWIFCFNFVIYIYIQMAFFFNVFVSSLIFILFTSVDTIKMS